jgi:acyl dehydratase
VSESLREFATVDEVLAAVGTQLGTSDWVLIDQARIDAFADATDDHQWIHTDPVRAAEGPFGTTIAHGLLTLSMVPALVGRIYRATGARMSINYGSDRVRFVNPVKAGARIRASSTMKSAEPKGDGQVQVAVITTIEIENEDKPAAVVEHLGRYYF